MTTQPKEFGLRFNVTKEQAIKAILDQEYEDVLRLPDGLAPKGMVYASADLNRGGRVRMLIGKGWKFVPADRHPELAFSGTDSVDPRTANLIFVAKNLVLMERSVELCEIEQKNLDRKHAQLLRCVPELENAPMATQVNSRTYTKLTDDNGRDASFG